VNKKVKKKMSLSRETLRNLEDTRLQAAAGGVTLGGTNPCSECTICLSCFDTCMQETMPCMSCDNLCR